MTMYATQIDVDCSFQTIDEWEWEKINITKRKCENRLMYLKTVFHLISIKIREKQWGFNAMVK